MSAVNETRDPHAVRARRHRLVRELLEGRRGRRLRAVDVLGHVSELLALGESVSSLRKLGPRLPPKPPTLDEEAARVICEAQSLFEFDPRAWQLLGVDLRRLEARRAAS